MSPTGPQPAPDTAGPGAEALRSTRARVEAVWRIEAARLIAGLARIVRDVALAEDLAQDALVIALEQWPRTGVPDDPGPWLMATAKHRAIDAVRRRTRYAEKLALLGRDAEARLRADIGHRRAEAETDDRIDDHIGDDLLRLVFTAAHPALSTEARVALVLRLLGGLSTAEIARAFLVSEATAAQRIVRAKRRLVETAVPFELPPRAELPRRLAAVLQVVYLIFNEGYAASRGTRWTRPQLCQEAMRLGRLLTRLLPDEPEVHGLSALMELQASRLPARADRDGDPVPLLEQDRTRWDHLLIHRGRRALARAEALGAGPYTVQAAVAACHARATRAGDTDWPHIAALYEVLLHLQPTPVVRLNRALAVGFAYDPARGLALLDELTAEPALRGYPQLPAARGELLGRLGRVAQAREQFRRAAALTGNDAERLLFTRRADALL